VIEGAIEGELRRVEAGARRVREALWSAAAVTG
jgi:hypothetical protein